MLINVLYAKNFFSKTPKRTELNIEKGKERKNSKKRDAERKEFFEYKKFPPYYY